MGYRARIAAAAAVLLSLVALPGRPAMGQVVGTLALLPASGQAGTGFTATGGFPACQSFTVKWDVPHTVYVGNAATRTATGFVPQGAPPGRHTVTANCVPPGGPEPGTLGIATASYEVFATPEPVPPPLPPPPPPRIFNDPPPVVAVTPTTVVVPPETAFAPPPGPEEATTPPSAADIDRSPRSLNTSDGSDGSDSDSYAGLVVAACLALLLAAVAVLFAAAYRRRRDDYLVVPAVPEMASSPMPGRDLTEVVDHLLGGAKIPALAAAGPASSRVGEACFDDAVATPLIATLLWESFVTDARFAETLRQAGASDRALDEGRVLVVRHAGETRHDLMVLDPGFTGDEPLATPVDLQPSAATAADRRELLSWSALLAADGQEPWSLLDEVTITAALQEAAETAEFGLVVAAPPRVLLSHSPSPAWSVGVPGERAPVATVGALVEAPDGTVAVTTALHAVGERPSVLVAGRPGAVTGTHEPTDSCLVSAPDLPVNPRGRGKSGSLRGLCPAQFDRFAFEGVTSGHTTTTVTAWELEILAVGRYPGARVYTTAETVPGDSGAALVDSADRMLGFAVSRSAFGEPVEYSAWVWADQVFGAHGVRLRAPAALAVSSDA